MVEQNIIRFSIYHTINMSQRINNLLDVTNLVLRNQTNIQMQKKAKTEIKPSAKRPATSPAKGSIQKRSALGDITNAGQQSKNQAVKDASKKAESTKQTSKRRSKRIHANILKNQPQVVIGQDDSVMDSIISSSQDSTSSGNTSYSSALSEEIKSLPQDILESPTPTCFYEHLASPSRRELNFNDLDAANSENIYEAPEYAFVIFEYMRARESNFVIEPRYLSKQKEVSSEMRAIVVDWMVEIQESFELNHETLYLAVKLVDHYLQKVSVSRDRLQLVGATSLLIAAKFDERHPPYVDDFLYICDDTYTKRDLLEMERQILKVIGFDINIPVPYRFLRRYAKCAKSNMRVLTLARFILELSLQHYAVVHESASKLAAAALWLAFKMDGSSQQWDDTLVYYTSHTEKDIIDIACELSRMIVSSKQKNLKTVWTKYSHSIFYEVAKSTPLSEDRLAEEQTRVCGSSMSAELLQL
uniref:G2/mitotic-specific cyclin-B3 n=1 Tax=Phallusia mammillata TaxID=59560 RepID=A0A6F9D8W8_9ASCI|nr:G2/mitotic-specific cyclin-B3 [Phallusia mammillata]